MWTSHSIDTAGILERLDVAGTTEHRHLFTREAQPTAADVPVGTTVVAFNHSQRS